MKRIWQFINAREVGVTKKNTLFMLANMLICMCLGLLIWIIGGRLLMAGAQGAICFAGYPAIFIGFFGSILYLYNHSFGNEDVEELDR